MLGGQGGVKKHASAYAEINCKNQTHTQVVDLCLEGREE